MHIFFSSVIGSLSRGIGPTYKNCNYHGEIAWYHGKKKILKWQKNKHIWRRRFASHRRPPSFDDCRRTVQISVSWKCYGTARANMLGKIEVEIFPTLAALQIYQRKWSSTFWRQRLQKCVKKSCQKIVKKLRKSGSGGCFGRSGGLPGAMSSRLGRRSAKMHTRSRQIGLIWSHLGGQVGAKILKKGRWKNC